MMRWSDRAWWVIESVFRHSLDNGFWIYHQKCPDGQQRVFVCNLMLKCCGILRSISYVLGSDSPH